MKRKSIWLVLLAFVTALCMLISACGGTNGDDVIPEEPDIEIPDDGNGKEDEEPNPLPDDGENGNNGGKEDEQDPPLKESKGLKFYHDGDDSSWVVDKGTCEDWEIVIPAYYEGMPVTGVSVDGFMRANISSVYLPETVTFLNNRAFYDCNYLREINLTESITEIHWRAFAYTGFESIALPVSITVIESQVFYKCTNLTEVTIPASVTEIWSGAFLACRYLKDIYYLGTKQEWEAIEKGTSWDCDEEYSTEIFDYVPVPRAYTVHCADGDIEVMIEA